MTLDPLLTVETALGVLNELYSKYRYMETSFEKSKGIYKSKIPETAQTIELIKMMMQKQDNAEDMLVNYSLCDTIYSKAQVRLQSFEWCQLSVCYLMLCSLL